MDRFFGPSQGQFVMMGRGFVRGVVEAMGGDDPAKRIFLYGPQGVGKSHILAAVALFCSVRRAKGDVGAPPVCYIPDMKEALSDDKYLFKCFIQAFIDQSDVLAEIVSIGVNANRSFNLPSLVGWARASTGVLFIADQCNEVGNTQLPKDVALNEMVEGVGADNWLLFAASSNQTKVDVFYVGSGGDKALKMMVEKFSYEEYCVFVRSNFLEEAALLAPNVRPVPVGQDPTLIDLVEEITGFLPLHVRTFWAFCPRSAGHHADMLENPFNRATAELLLQYGRTEKITRKDEADTVSPVIHSAGAFGFLPRPIVAMPPQPPNSVHKILFIVHAYLKRLPYTG